MFSPSEMLKNVLWNLYQFYHRFSKIVSDELARLRTPIEKELKVRSTLKMSSAEVVCCKLLPNITDKLSIEANSVDPEQTAPIGAV